VSKLKYNKSTTILREKSHRIEYRRGASFGSRVRKTREKKVTRPTRPDCHPASRHLVRSELKAIAPQRTDTTKGTSNAVIPRKRNSIAISHPILAVSENPPSSILRLPPPPAVQPPSTLIGLLLPLSFRRSVSINTDLIYFAGK